MNKIKISLYDDILTVSKILLKNGNEHTIYADGIGLVEHESRLDDLLGKNSDGINNIKIGDKFYHLKYAGQYIEWEVVEILENDELIMYSTKILEAIAFNDDCYNLKYKNSKIEKWCKSIKNNVFIPRKNQVSKWYPTEKLRQCSGTKRAIETGLCVDYYTRTSPYWINDEILASTLYNHVGSVQTSGEFIYTSTNYPHVGARPAIRLKYTELF